MTTGIEQTAPEGTADTATAAFLRLLEKLFKTGSYYPASHEKTRALTAEFMAAMIPVLDGAEELVFDVRENALHLQGEAAPSNLPGVAGFLALLEPLAIVRLSLDAHIPAADLHAFVTLLPQLQVQARDHGFGEPVAFQGLPNGVSLHQREFVTSTRDDDVAIGNLDLAGHTDESLSDTEHSLDMLVDLLDCSMIGDHGARTQDAFQKLVGVLDRPEPEDLRTDGRAAPAGPGDSELDHGMSIDELQQLLDEAMRGVDEFPPRDLGDHREFLSILGGLLDRELGPALAHRLERDLRAALRRRLAPGERALLIRALRAALGSPALPRPAPAVGLVVRAFRKAEHESALGLLMEVGDSGATGAQGVRDRLWPYILNEVLCNAAQEIPDAIPDVRSRLLPVPGRDLDGAVRTFLALDAASGGAFAQDNSPSYPGILDPVFAEIIRRTSDNPVTRALVLAMHGQPPSWIGSVVLPLVRLDPDDHRDFYAALLDRNESPETLHRLRCLAADLIRGRLFGLPRSLRHQPWVRPAILALEGLHGVEVDDILERVLSERRWWIVPSWPRGCRASAQLVRKRRRQDRKGGAACPTTPND